MNLQTVTLSDAPVRIVAIDTQIVDVPFRRLQRFARLDAHAQSSVVIQIQCSDGVVGVGESVVPCGPWWSGDSVEAMKLTIDRYLAPRLTGEVLRGLGPTLADLDRVARGNAFAKAGIEMALVDLIGKRLGVPAVELLGGAFRTECAVAWPIASGDAQKDRDEIEQMLGTGRASAFKVKMGAETLEPDLDRIEALMAALDGRAGLRVDPNEAWSETDAMRALPQLAAMGVDLVEQPVPREQMEVLARIAYCAPLPIMIDEGAQSEAQTLAAIRVHAAHILSLKLMKAGGLYASRRMADIAMTGGMSPYMGTFLETSIGTAAGLHLAASLPILPFGGEVVGPMLLADDIVMSPIRYENGAAQLPEGPGIGIELDEDKLRQYRRT